MVFHGKRLARRATFLVFIGAGGFLLAHTVNAVVAELLTAPVAPVHAPSRMDASASRTEDPAEMAQSILASGVLAVPREPRQEGEDGHLGQPNAPPIDAARKVSLLGTVIGDEGGVAAVLENLGDKRQTFYRVHDHVPDIGELTRIEKTRVLFRQGGREEWLDLALAKSAAASFPSPPSARSASPATRLVLDRREVAQIVDDVPRLLTQAQPVPYLIDGKLSGFRLDSVVPQGFFDRIGLRTGDVLQRVNGVEISDPGMLLRLFQQSKHERFITVDVVRQNERTRLSYEIR